MNEIEALKKCEKVLEEVVNSINHNIGINEETTLVTARLWNAVDQMQRARSWLVRWKLKGKLGSVPSES